MQAQQVLIPHVPVATCNTCNTCIADALLSCGHMNIGGLPLQAVSLRRTSES